MKPDASGLPWVWAPEYEMEIGPHVFPTVKYRLVKERLLEEGVLSEDHRHRPHPASQEELGRVHSSGYLGRALEGRLTPGEELQLELPYSDGLRDAFRLCCGGTILAGRLALESGVAAHLGGGFHHAFAGHGEGFCLLNDVAVATEALLAEAKVSRVAIVDLDVHHGNGTAAIFQGRQEVFTFSMHEENNYPAVKPPGDLDVGLEDGTDDDLYLQLLEDHLTRILKDHAPELIFYLAGADPYREDQLGGLALTLEGLRRRDAMVLSLARAADAAVAVVLAGGYAVRLEDTVEIHCGTVREGLRALRGGGS